MRGIPSLITDIRKNVFTEVARMAYAGGDYTNAEDLPYKIVPGDLCHRLFTQHGFRWGGSWKNSKDYQHFEWARH